MSSVIVWHNSRYFKRVAANGGESCGLCAAVNDNVLCDHISQDIHGASSLLCSAQSDEEAGESIPLLAYYFKEVEV